MTGNGKVLCKDQKGKEDTLLIVVTRCAQVTGIVLTSILVARLGRWRGRRHCRLRPLRCHGRDMVPSLLMTVALTATVHTYAYWRESEGASLCQLIFKHVLSSRQSSSSDLTLVAEVRSAFCLFQTCSRKYQHEP